MNTQYCRVGTIRPNEGRPQTSRGLTNAMGKIETKRTRYKGKLSK